MRLKTRIHEWMADHVSWVQYPNVREYRKPRRSYLSLDEKQRGWLLFVIFWGGVIALSIFGNLIE